MVIQSPVSALEHIKKLKSRIQEKILIKDFQRQRLFRPINLHQKQIENGT